MFFFGNYSEDSLQEERRCEALFFCFDNFTSIFQHSLTRHNHELNELHEPNPSQPSCNRRAEQWHDNL